MAGQQRVFAQMSRSSFFFETATSVLEFIDTFFGRTAEQRACPETLHCPACENRGAIPYNFRLF
ncbi:hypothetical protein FFI89_015490 [Bradyrhizobium sp. KBS0727]|uniref:hypothetical protein n=1 Tax=unclassified Bradyrhizobium TaxID=2631580 RepID=UPI00110DE5C4|nr:MULTISPECIES: hypothetical protein [unclassified Bradyrhizobium]QDW38424.1 hypothetical protein FFI71_015485 [Bradyrhizobium sp. KBS0725]QDW45027.1 hypothetical protein FFI89_015490 [Bradyrhizobium sp. KBS0727]